MLPASGRRGPPWWGNGDRYRRDTHWADQSRRRHASLPKSVSTTLKLGIVSDIRGNFASLQGALAAMGPVDELLCLGDSIDRSRFANDVVALLKRTSTQSSWAITRRCSCPAGRSNLMPTRIGSPSWPASRASGC